MRSVNTSAVEFEQQTQHAVRARVLGAHVQQHGFALDGPIGDQMSEFFEGGIHFFVH